MAKQKVVLKLSMENAKKRAKALQCAVGVNGVESASHDGDKITVVGEGIDSVALTTLLRRKIGPAELMMVTAVEEKKAEGKGKEEANSISIPPYNQPYYYVQPVGVTNQPPYYYVDVREPSNDNCCIM